MKIKVLKLRIELSEQTVRGFQEQGASSNNEIKDRVVEHLQELLGEMADAGEVNEDEADEDSDIE